MGTAQRRPQFETLGFSRHVTQQRFTQHVMSIEIRPSALACNLGHKYSYEEKTVTPETTDTSDLIGIIERIRDINAKNGFWTGPVEMDRKLMLAVGELAEAQEELRNGRELTEVYYEESKNGQKPCGFGIEVIDSIIRDFDCLTQAGYTPKQIVWMIHHKSDYNAKRGFKHHVGGFLSP